MINAQYGKPVLVRFENHLDENPLDLDRQDFGSPDWSFLTHLHNAHTAPESDGNPHYCMPSGPSRAATVPRPSCDNLYLNWPAGGDDREKQSFFWYHDHRMNHTGSNVYKGHGRPLPDLRPEERRGHGRREPGPAAARRPPDHPDGSFDVDYDVPLAFYDCRLDDGVTTHKDVHDGIGEFLAAGNPKTHPEWWGKTFYKHFPNHGFVGDIFTVNGTAYPTMEVKAPQVPLPLPRRLDRPHLRVQADGLDAGSEVLRLPRYIGDELEGQYRIPDGQQCMKFTQIASDGGLLPFALTRDSFELWPAKRREVIIDFTRYHDGTPTTKGDVVYLTNVMKMPDGRMWTNSSRSTPDPAYMVPMLKFVIGDAAPDRSVMPKPGQLLRALRPLPSNWQSMLDNRLVFEVNRGSVSADVEWLINGV